MEGHLEMEVLIVCHNSVNLWSFFNEFWGNQCKEISISPASFFCFPMILPDQVFDENFSPLVLNSVSSDPIFFHLY